MEAQLHRDYDDPLHPAADVVHAEEERGGEPRSAMKKVKEKVDKLKATIKHGHHKDEAQTVNDSPVVKSGLAEPTIMGTPVLAEDLYATHSDILDTPVRSFAQWEDEERRGAPPPLSTAYETHLTYLPPQHTYTYGKDVYKEQLNKGSIGKHNLLEKEDRKSPPPPSTTVYGTGLSEVGHHAYGGGDLNTEEPAGNRKSTTVSPANLRDTDSGEKEAGITEVLHSFNKMKVFNESDTKSQESDQNKPKMYTGSHDQFAPEPVENPPLDTVAANPSSPNSSYTQKTSSATSAIADKAAAVKDSIVSKLSPSNDNYKSGDASTMSHKATTSFPTTFSHKVADTLSSTLGPIYEKVAGAGRSAENAERNTNTKKTVKEYLVDTFKPGEDDKVLSEVITHALHRGGNQSPRGD